MPGWTIPDKGEGQWFVYELTDPLSGACRYVGKTTNPTRRLGSHMNEARSPKRNTHRTKWIASLGCMPLMRIIEAGLSSDAASEREIWWIAERRRQGCRLTNATKGGEGVCGLRHSAEARARISAANLGHAVSEETRKRISEAQKGKARARGFKHSQEERARRSERMRGRALFAGRKHSAETIERMKAAHLERWARIKGKADAL